VRYTAGSRISDQWGSLLWSKLRSRSSMNEKLVH